jgi:hypothetical protein
MLSMLYDWVQGWTIHHEILKNIELENHFNTKLFPQYKICEVSYSYEHNAHFSAIYNHKKHWVLFSHLGLNSDDMWFSQTYFHELIHSTTKYSKRLHKMWDIVQPVTIKQEQDFYGIEERIADLGSIILCATFTTDKIDLKPIVKQAFKISCNETKYALPWKEIEDAVLFYVKNKTCFKLHTKLQLVKQIIMDNSLTPIYEGYFDGR